jgi:hypothetical protein
MGSLVNGFYDAVKLAATLDGGCSLVLSDTTWPGYEMIPQWVIGRYATILSGNWRGIGARAAKEPDLVVVQIGVGALTAAAVQHYPRKRLLLSHLVGQRCRFKQSGFAAVKRALWEKTDADLSRTHSPGVLTERNRWGTTCSPMMAYCCVVGCATT